MHIVYLAIVGQQNNPLYLKSFAAGDPERDLRLQFIVHCSLDAVEDKVLYKRSPAEAGDPYLGLLYPTEEFRVYGYISNTSTKFLAVVEGPRARDDAMARTLHALHALYVDTLCNPFFAPPLATPKFDAAVERIVSSGAKS